MVADLEPLRMIVMHFKNEPTMMEAAVVATYPATTAEGSLHQSSC